MSKATERAVTDAAALFFALGAGTRLTIVKRLGEGEPLSATALGDGGTVSGGFPRGPAPPSPSVF